jgi:hypothetical protein
LASLIDDLTITSDENQLATAANSFLVILLYLDFSPCQAVSVWNSNSATFYLWASFHLVSRVDYRSYGNGEPQVCFLGFSQGPVWRFLPTRGIATAISLPSRYDLATDLWFVK